MRPWGVLNGVRPTKKARNLLASGISKAELPRVLARDYKIKKSKIKLLLTILENQEIAQGGHLVDFYINIPICPTRCAYCSFISAELCAVQKLLPDYIAALVKEVKEAKALIKRQNLKVRSVYMGGGTPSVLTAGQLEEILGEVGFGDVEFTVECGRPDTITKEKLEALKRCGVTRISINPQTFCQATLDKIGRKHTVEKVFESFALAREMGFDINMDLIAGLEGESFGVFKKSLGYAMELRPENLTVHTLSIKKGSNLAGQKIKNRAVRRMVDWAYKKLVKAGYVPYYMYRQKNQLGNLENIGYSMKGKQCAFNIDSMEETVSVIACGANATSKLVDVERGKIERVHNAKFLPDYIQRLDELMEKKNKMFEL